MDNRCQNISNRNYTGYVTPPDYTKLKTEIFSLVEKQFTPTPSMESLKTQNSEASFTYLRLNL